MFVHVWLVLPALGYAFGTHLEHQWNTTHLSHQLGFGPEATITALVIVGSKDHHRVHHCTGSILSPQWILTAAHCLFVHGDVSADIKISTTRSKLSVRNYFHKAELVFLHAKFNPSEGNYDNDIALIKLDSPLDMSRPEVRSVRLTDREEAPQVGQECLIVGWGKRFVPSKSRSTLQSTPAFVEKCHGASNKDIEEKICLSARKGCHADVMWMGDAGGPVLCGGLLAGLVSTPHHSADWCPAEEASWRLLGVASAQRISHRRAEELHRLMDDDKAPAALPQWIRTPVRTRVARADPGAPAARDARDVDASRDHRLGEHKKHHGPLWKPYTHLGLTHGGNARGRSGHAD